MGDPLKVGHFVCISTCFHFFHVEYTLNKEHFEYICIYMGQNASTGSMLCPKFFATYRGVRGLKMFVDLLSFESRVALFEIQDGGLNMAAERWPPPHEFKVLFI